MISVVAVVSCWCQVAAVVIVFSFPSVALVVRVVARVVVRVEAVVCAVVRVEAVVWTVMRDVSPLGTGVSVCAVVAAGRRVRIVWTGVRASSAADVVCVPWRPVETVCTAAVCSGSASF